MSAANEDIVKLLADQKAWTFQDAIDGVEDDCAVEESEYDYPDNFDDDMDLQDCLGGYINTSYEEWVEEILADMDDIDDGCEEDEDWDDED